jgi:hypothetical protein
MSAIDEAKARLESTKKLVVELCPRCHRDTCSCYASGEFWEMQRGMRSRDAEIAALRSQLADAESVMSAMRDDLEESVQYASEYFREKWDLGASLTLVAAYDAKHRTSTK